MGKKCSRVNRERRKKKKNPEFLDYLSTVLGKILHVCLAHVLHVEELDFMPEKTTH